MGREKKHFLKSELISRKNARRSIVAKILIKKGEKIKNYHLTWKRPGTGVGPENIKLVLGKIAKKNINEDSLIKLNDLK